VNRTSRHGNRNDCENGIWSKFRPSGWRPWASYREPDFLGSSSILSSFMSGSEWGMVPVLSAIIRRSAPSKP
jgi:hypothetical protein